MTENQTKVTHSVPVLGLLGVAFVVLKLCNVIHWSWWLVTLPFWGPPALALAFLLAILLLACVVSVLAFIGYCCGALYRRLDK